MADHEVAKHTKKVYKIWGNKAHSLWHKLKEFFIEILIIVFAVSVSIWFHNMSEKRHDKAEGHKFLIGLKSDLEKDIIEMKSDTESYHLQLEAFTKLTDINFSDKDSNVLKQNGDVFFNTTALIPNISRFEALKYSGKMNTIENTELLDEIINLYEEKIPKLVNDGLGSSKYKTDEVFKLIESHQLYDKYPMLKFLPEIKSNKKLQFIFKNCKRSCRYIIDLYIEVLQQNQKLILMIDEELKK